MQETPVHLQLFPQFEIQDPTVTQNKPMGN